jgi:hypothetical protein
MMFLDAVERDGSHTVKKYLKQYELNKDTDISMLEKSMIDFNPDYARYVDDSRGPTSFSRRFLVLVMRELTIAARNPSLYYLHLFLLIIIGIFVGAVFYGTKSNVDVSVKNVPAGIVWIIFMMSYVQVFKVRSPHPFFIPLTYLSSPQLGFILSWLPYLDLPHIALPCVSLHCHPTCRSIIALSSTVPPPPPLLNLQIYHLSRASALFKHERANNTVSVLATFFADLTTSAIGLLSVIPGSAVSYFMMGFPNEAYPFIMFVFWMVSTAEHGIVCALLQRIVLYWSGVECSEVRCIVLY